MVVWTAAVLAGRVFHNRRFGSGRKSSRLATGIEASRHRRGRACRARLLASRSPPTATPPSWAGLSTTAHRGGVGLHPQRRYLDPAGQQAGRHRRGWNAEQGSSVALSADGNTAIVGGPDDNAGTGRRGSSRRSGGVWTQQGSKLVGTGAVGQRRARLLRRAVCRRQHRHRGRA